MEWWDRRMHAECQCNSYRGGANRTVEAHLLEAATAASRGKGASNACGIYALSSLPNLLRYHNNSIRILAQCVCYGVVLVTDNGYKATDVRIDRLWIIVEDASTYQYDDAAKQRDALAARYGVPVDVITKSELGRMKAEHEGVEAALPCGCVPDAYTLGAPAINPACVEHNQGQEVRL